MFIKQLLDYNNIPLSECDGFTPLQMRSIVHYPFEKDCPIKLNKSIYKELFNESPILKIVFDLLSIINSKEIKLTPNGNLPVKVIEGIYSKNYLLDKMIENGIVKIHTETDWTILHNVKLILILAGFIKKKYNHLSLTKKGELLLMGEKYPVIFYEFLKTFTLKFNWAYNDRFIDESVGQLGFLYVMHLINKYGDKEREINYFTDLYFMAFPSFKDIGIDDSMNDLAFYVRFIERFALWFGFIKEREIKGKNYFEREIKIKRTKLLNYLLRQ